MMTIDFENIVGKFAGKRNSKHRDSDIMFKSYKALMLKTYAATVYK